MHTAVIGERSHGIERHGENEPGIVYSRIKYSIRITWRAGRHAVIVAGPSPIDDIASLDGDRARVIDGSTLSHGDICRRRRSEHGEQDQKRERQLEIHFWRSSAQLGRILAWNIRAAIEWDESVYLAKEGNCGSGKRSDRRRLTGAVALEPETATFGNGDSRKLMVDG